MAIHKQPYKIIEIPLGKFIEEVIPHHENQYELYKKQMEKILKLNDSGQLTREIKDKKRAVKQLKDLMYELDTLRAQVEDCDLDKFDVKTLTMRKKILKLISGYAELEKAVDRKLNNDVDNEDEVNTQNPFAGVQQIQLDAPLEQLEDKCRRVEVINDEVQGLQEIYQHLNTMVHEQGEQVNVIEEATESTNVNVQSGERFLQKASKYKAAAYPVTGAFIGTIIGGPIGFLAGLKVGGAAAIGCAIAGYSGGHYLKKATETNEEIDTENNENIENEQIRMEKKDI